MTLTFGQAVPLKNVFDKVRGCEITLSGVSSHSPSPGSSGERFSLRLVVEVIASNKHGCPARSKTRPGARGRITLIDHPRGAPDRFVNAYLDLACSEEESWVSSDSDVGISVTLKKR